MYLAILACDLKEISFALLENGCVCASKSVFVSPETYLQALEATLLEWGVVADALNGVIVVVGSGSFTSNRTGATIANAIAFTREIPVFTIENFDHKPLVELLEGFVPSAETAVSFVYPVYDRPANITHPK